MCHNLFFPIYHKHLFLRCLIPLTQPTLPICHNPIFPIYHTHLFLRCLIPLTHPHSSHMSQPILPICHKHIFLRCFLSLTHPTLPIYHNPILPSISQAFIFEVFDSSHSPHSSHMSQPHSSLYVNNIFPTSPTHLTLTDSCRDRRPTSSSGSHLHSAARCATTMTRGRRRGSTTATPTTSSPRSPKTYTRRVDTPSALIASHGSSGKRRHVPNSVYTTQTESNRYR